MAVVAEYLKQTKCHRCDKPPLTFDEHDRALCARHATILLAARRPDQQAVGTPDEDRAQP